MQSRLRIAFGVLAATALALSPAAAQTKPRVPGTFPPLLAGKPYAGTTIKVPSMKGWASFQPVIDRHAEFEALTGIRVELDLMPGTEIPTKQLLEVSQRTGAYDLVQQHALSFGSFFPWVEPLDDRIRETWGSVEQFEQWVFPAQAGVRGPDGRHYFIPFHANVQIGYYRRRLFEDPKEREAFRARHGYDLAPPRTIREIEQIAMFFTRPDRGLYGLTANWGFGQGFGAFLDYYMAAGQSWLDRSHHPSFNAGEGRALAIRIARWQVDAAHGKKFVNPDAVTFTTGQVSDYFISGAAAMAYGWLSDYWPLMQKPDTIARTGPVGTFRFPSFTGADAGGYASWWMMGITKDSRHPDAAWEYVKWVLNERQQRAMAAEGGQLPPIRRLAHRTAVHPGGVNPRALFDAFQQARIPVQVPQLSQAPLLRGRELHAALMARKITPEQFVDDLADVTEKTLEKAGLIK
jgi:multiple sugar transport system substrate-binding protein